MSVVWSMTSTDSGQFQYQEKHSELQELVDAFNLLRSRSQGYMEVRLSDKDFPQMTLSFQGGQAVIHLFTKEEIVSLLAGDGSVPADVAVEFPIMDDPVDFTGDFILGLDRAWEIVEDFAQTGEFEGLGEWCEL
ncbi:hypothetical protein [Streptomyces griseorubiginosus]|uniref:hypothetical protein n=1 Tax=Streptomyces griseorubiginosus TaxID=67304 RepID=UPI0036E33C64